MPTQSEMRIPVPQSPYEFESICLDYIQSNYPYSNAQRYGRQGQNQHGIDIYGRNFEMLVQCKNCYVSATTNASQQAKRLIQKIAIDYNNAKQYFPNCKQFIIMTTFDRDVGIQNNVATLGNNVSILFWDDIVDFLYEHLDILKKYYPLLFTYNSPVSQIDIQTLNDMIAIANSLKSYADFFYRHSNHSPFYNESIDIQFYNNYVEMYNLTLSLVTKYSNIAVQTMKTSIGVYVDNIKNSIPPGYDDNGNGECLFVLTDILRCFNTNEKLDNFKESCSNLILEIQKLFSK